MTPHEIFKALADGHTVVDKDADEEFYFNDSGHLVRVDSDDDKYENEETFDFSTWDSGDWIVKKKEYKPTQKFRHAPFGAGIEQQWVMEGNEYDNKWVQVEV